jgi:hypothetical protein
MESLVPGAKFPVCREASYTRMLREIKLRCGVDAYLVADKEGYSSRATE